MTRRVSESDARKDKGGGKKRGGKLGGRRGKGRKKLRVQVFDASPSYDSAQTIMTRDVKDDLLGKQSRQYSTQFRQGRLEGLCHFG